MIALVVSLISLFLAAKRAQSAQAVRKLHRGHEAVKVVGPECFDCSDDYASELRPAWMIDLSWVELFARAGGGGSGGGGSGGGGAYILAFACYVRRIGLSKDQKKVSFIRGIIYRRNDDRDDYC